MSDSLEDSLNKSKLLVVELLKGGELLDSDGYPTESAISIIKNWPLDDPAGWFKFIEELWGTVTWGRGIEPDPWNKNKTMDLIYVSTGGWSGNETLIRAMQDNFLWQLTWVQSRRGGHHIFELKDC
jgi:hypothetical protein